MNDDWRLLLTAVRVFRIVQRCIESARIYFLPTSIHQHGILMFSPPGVSFILPHRNALRHLLSKLFHALPLKISHVRMPLKKESSTVKMDRSSDRVTLWSRVLLEKLIITHLVKCFPKFYGTRRFITVFTRSRELDASSPELPIISKIYSNIILPSTPRSSDRSLPFRFTGQTVVCISVFRVR
jgi:hypothetical protein